VANWQTGKSLDARILVRYALPDGTQAAASLAR
jgi:hypothetical protein